MPTSTGGRELHQAGYALHGGPAGIPRPFLEDREKYRELRGVVEGQPANHFDVSCLPWVRYRHFDVHVFDRGDFLAPVVTWGKYEAEGSRLVMPLTMNIHHAVADGFHLSRFFTEVQERMDRMAADSPQAEDGGEQV